MNRLMYFWMGLVTAATIARGELADDLLTKAIFQQETGQNYTAAMVLYQKITENPKAQK